MYQGNAKRQRFADGRSFWYLFAFRFLLDVPQKSFFQPNNPVSPNNAGLVGEP